MLIFKPSDVSSTQFVQFWRHIYGDDQTEKLYSDNIRQELTDERILKLFEWKNGSRLPRHKEAAVRKNFIQRRGELDQLRPDQKIEDLVAYFPDGDVIFRIFWLHCWRPDRFPIYDQHVHRAMAFILSREREEIPADDTPKITAYIQQYMPFHATFDTIDIPSLDRAVDRTVDKALWAFGKFLADNPSFPTDTSVS